MIQVVDQVRDALWMIVSASIPLLAGALAGGTVAGIVAGWFGLQDTTVAAAFRAAGVLIAVVMVAASVADQLTTFTAQSWQALPELGHGERP